MARPKIRPGGWAWVGLTGYVLLADTLLIKNNKLTMSSVFGDSISHPIRRWPVIAAWAILTMHLFSNFIPEELAPVKRADPIKWIAAHLT